MSPDDFAAAIGAFCFAFRASVTSALRTDRHNAAVGGVPGSAHRFSLAVDVVYDEHIDEALAREYARRLGLRLIRETGHDHLQPLDWPKG